MNGFQRRFLPILQIRPLFDVLYLDALKILKNNSGYTLLVRGLPSIADYILMPLIRSLWP